MKFCRLVTQGFNNLNSKSFNSHDHRPGLGLPPRIPVSSQLLLELAHGAYFAMFNEFYTLALEAVNDIAARASYEGYPDVLLVTGAVTNSLQANPSGISDFVLKILSHHHNASEFPTTMKNNYYKKILFTQQ